MERIREYFDRVKADDELKEKTKSYISEKIALEREKRKYTWKRFAIAAIPITACLIILIGGYAYYQTPINYISLDINPSVELGLNRLDRVVEAEGVNEDGKSILNVTNVLNLSADDAIIKLLLEAEEKGYIRKDGSTVIALTVLSDRREEAAELKNQIDQVLGDLTAGGVLHAVFYTDAADLQLRSAAREYGLSPGKYKLILQLQSLDPDFGIEQYRNAGITDIFIKKEELMRQKEENTETTMQNTEITKPIQKQTTDQKQNNSGDPGKTQAVSPDEDGQSQETSPQAVEAQPEQTVSPAEKQMTDQPAEGQEQSNNSNSPGGQGGSQNNKQSPN